MEDKKEEKIIDYSPTGKSGGSRLFSTITIILFLVTWAAIGALWAYADVNLRNIDSNSEVNSLKTKINQLEEKLVKFGEMVNDNRKLELAALPPALPEKGVTANNTVEIDAVTHDELAIVSERIKLLERDITELKTLEEDIENTKNIASQITQGGTYGPLVMALTQVQNQVNKGVPFRKELQLVSIEAGEDTILTQHIRILEAHSQNGVATVEQLKDDFKKIAGSVVKEANKSDSKNLWDRTKNELVGMVSIRKVDNVEGDTAEAVVARAEKALDRFDLTEAVLELDALEDKPKAILSDWLARASNRVAVEYAIDGIQKYVTKSVIKSKSN